MAEDKNYKHIIRVANTDIDGAKPIKHSLMKIKGVGFMFANLICSLAKIDKNKKTGSLNDEEVRKLTDVVTKPEGYEIPTWMLNRRKDPEDGQDKHIITADLIFTTDNDKKRMKKIKSYRGFRHMAGLPCRGQRTKSNFRNKKGTSLGVKRRTGAKKGR